MTPHARHLSPPEPLAYRPLPCRRRGLYGPVSAVERATRKDAEYWQDHAADAFAGAAYGETDWPSELTLILNADERPPSSVRFAIKPWPGQPDVWFEAYGRRLRDTGLDNPRARYWAYAVKEIG
ncbi:hypothetical protein [Alienimonas sp. DA493]|uniref:hypothetical protein n=1 Tax=Alienimonas sp. DA493 TaxID=3373605 RepID=UPI0037546970